MKVQTLHEVVLRPQIQQDNYTDNKLDLKTTSSLTRKFEEMLKVSFKVEGNTVYHIKNERWTD